MFQDQKRGSLPEQDEGQKYFSQMPLDQQQLLRAMLTAIKEKGLLSKECNPQSDDLHTLLCHGVPRNGRSITDIAVGPGVYSPQNELAQDAVRYQLVPENVGEREIRCTYITRNGFQGRCQTFTFERQPDNSLKLTGAVVHEM